MFYLCLFAVALAFGLENRRRRPPRRRLEIFVDGMKDVEMQFKDSQKLKVTLSAVDALGKAAKLADGAAPKWDVSDKAVASVAAAADGMSAEVSCVDLGKFQVQVSVAAQGDEPAIVGVSDEHEFVGGDAVSVKLSVAAEADAPAAPAAPVEAPAAPVDAAPAQA